MLDELKKLSKDLDMLKEKLEKENKEVDKQTEFIKLLHEALGYIGNDEDKYQEVMNKASDLYDELGLKKEYGNIGLKELMQMHPSNVQKVLNKETRFSIVSKDNCPTEIIVCGKINDVLNNVTLAVSSWLKEIVKDKKLKNDEALNIIDELCSAIKENMEEK